MGTKFKALFQRSKGRDLFDVWYVLHNNLIDHKEVAEICMKYCSHEGVEISRAEFEKNLFEKKLNQKFLNDVASLNLEHTGWNFDKAFNLIETKLVSLLPGKSWKLKKNS